MAEESYEMNPASSAELNGGPADPEAGTSPVSGVGGRRAGAAKLEPLQIPAVPAVEQEIAAPSLIAARLFKPVTVSFKNLSYSVRNGIFRKGKTRRLPALVLQVFHRWDVLSTSIPSILPSSKDGAGVECRGVFGVIA